MRWTNKVRGKRGSKRAIKVFYRQLYKELEKIPKLGVNFSNIREEIRVFGERVHGGGFVA